jgi:pyroglutamyl-peptidase
MSQSSPPLVLVTAFEPFGGSNINPSGLVAEKLRAPGGWQLKYRVLPVVTSGLAERVEELVSTLNPSLVISLGEAQGSDVFRVEQTARNLLAFGGPDNSGVQIENEPIVHDGPGALASTICCDSVQSALSKTGVASLLSDDAGGFLCNQLFYLMAHRSLETGPKVGFLHLPSLPEQGYGQGLSLERQLVAVQAVLNRLCGGPDLI